MISCGQRPFTNLKAEITSFGITYLLLFLRLLLVMVLLSACRVGFYFYNTDFFPGMSIGHFLWLMWGGLRFDLVALLYVNLLYIVLLVVPINLRFKPLYTRVLSFYFCLQMVCCWLPMWWTLFITDLRCTGLQQTFSGSSETSITSVRYGSGFLLIIGTLWYSGWS